MTYNLDPAGRLVGMLHTLDATHSRHLAYSYDTMGNRTSTQRSINLQGQITQEGDVYGYDALDQITSVAYHAPQPQQGPQGALYTAAYAYDANGNRLGMSFDGQETPYTPAANANTYAQVNQQALGYDAQGNLTQKPGWTYTYDAQNRLVEASNGQSTTTLVYDALNRCVQRTTDGQTISLYYDGWNLVEERGPQGELLASYTHGAQTDELILQERSGETIYYHRDGLGSTVGLSDEQGQLIESYHYDVYGKATVFDDQGEPIEESNYQNRFLFTGREWVAEIKLYDYRNRVYDAELGRFMQNDPIGFDAGDWNLYRYVSNSPMNYIDPFGLESLKCCAGDFFDSNSECCVNGKVIPRLPVPKITKSLWMRNGFGTPHWTEWQEFDNPVSEWREVGFVTRHGRKSLTVKVIVEWERNREKYEQRWLITSRLEKRAVFENDNCETRFLRWEHRSAGSVTIKTETTEKIQYKETKQTSHQNWIFGGGAGNPISWIPPIEPPAN